MKPNYALIIGVLVVAVVIAVPVIFGMMQGTKVHMDDGTPIEKNITVFLNSISEINGEHYIMDTGGVQYYTSAQVASGMVTGRNYTISMLSINNHTGYWITKYVEIKPVVNKTKVK